MYYRDTPQSVCEVTFCAFDDLVTWNWEAYNGLYGVSVERVCHTYNTDHRISNIRWLRVNETINFLSDYLLYKLQFKLNFLYVEASILIYIPPALQIVNCDSISNCYAASVPARSADANHPTYIFKNFIFLFSFLALVLFLLITDKKKSSRINKICESELGT